MIGLSMLILAIATGFAPRLVDIVRAMAPTVRAHPKLQQKLASIKTVAIMPPSETVYQIAVGGATQLMDEETAAARPTLATAIGEAHWKLVRGTCSLLLAFQSNLLSFEAS